MNSRIFRLWVIALGTLALFGGSLTAAQTTTPSPTAAVTTTPAPTNTPFPTATATPTPTPRGTEMVLQIASGQDDVNETSGRLELGQPTIWVGNAGATTEQYLALRFTDVAINPGALIHTAHLEVYATSSQWIPISFDLFAEAADDSAPLTDDAPPSQRARTATSVQHDSNVDWTAGVWYPFDDISEVVQEVIDRPGWQAGRSLTIIAIGTESGGDFGRKFFAAFEAGAALGVRLVVDVTPLEMPASVIPTTTPTQAVTPTLAATGTVDACAAVEMPIRLGVGDSGMVSLNDSAPTTPVNVRETPGVDGIRIGRLAQGVTFEVLEGPVCANGVVWFKVGYGDDKEGWLAEGQDGLYFVEPTS